MTTDDRPRHACDNHGRYQPDCAGCKVARRAYETWRNPLDESDGRWAIRLVGDFTTPGQVFILSARDKGYARRRAAWWRAYRADVLVEVLCRSDRDAPWTMADDGDWISAVEVKALELRDRECWRFGCRLHVGDRARAEG